MKSVTDCFGSLVFDDRAMKAVLSKEIYEALRKTAAEGQSLRPGVADEVAAAMKDWAVSKGATHYTHWFQPLTGITAEKHESFLSPSEDGGAILDFSGKELIKGEPDASSFPSGGIRATFEARGYTDWDPTSYAFIKGNTLCIPTAFCSYGGEALDKKTPLLRSMQALSRQAMRILKLFGNTEARFVRPMVGAEQEYFLISREMFEKRPDLMFTGRTLFGAMPPKGQEMDDHYFGAIKPKVAAFMEDLDGELWKLGVPVKTEHNEVAPGQHELAPVYATANVATDQNQLTMEIMQKTAAKHGLACLLAEKPFAGVNGSGKHNNWSIATDTGVNLLSPGETPYENAQFLVFLCCVIQAVDDYQDLLRISVATAGNDHRLGANEAPPAIVSIFLGDELTGILEAVESGVPYAGSAKKQMKLGADVLPRFMRDTTDRNRTSPFAFTGNKFEFRMVGSSDSIASANVVLNSAVAESLRKCADELEKAEDLDAALHEWIRKTVTEHKRILFNGNGYDQEWVREAVEQRGLLNYRTTPDCLPHLTDEKNQRMLTRHGVFTEKELNARLEIMFENYCKTVMIEANTMLDMTEKGILPSVTAYTADLAETIRSKRGADSSIACGYEIRTVRLLSELNDGIAEKADTLRDKLEAVREIPDTEERAYAIRDRLIPQMEMLRDLCDRAEQKMPRGEWPYPGYGEILFSVH